MWQDSAYGSSTGGGDELPEAAVVYLPRPFDLSTFPSGTVDVLLQIGQACEIVDDVTETAKGTAISESFNFPQENS
jgi:hypothetical protein